MSLARMTGFVLIGLGLLAPLSATGQPAPKKASEEDIRKAREEIKRLTGEVDKLTDQLYDARRTLLKAQDKLDELEGRPYSRRFGDFRGFQPGRPNTPPRTAPQPPKQDPKVAAELEKRLDRIVKDLEEIRKEMRKPATPPSK